MSARESRYWLFKTEPSVFSFDDLWRAKGRRTLWDGVRNYQARNFMRDAMRVGDGVLLYHSSCDEPGVAGIARIAREAYPDPTQFDPADEHHDPKSDPDDPRWVAVDVEAVERLPRPVPLAAIKAEPRLAEMLVVQRGQRLSVQPVTAAEWEVVRELAALPKPSRSRSAAPRAPRGRRAPR